MKRLIEGFVDWLSENYNIKRLVFVNLGYLLWMIAFSGYIYHECYIAEYNIFSQSSLSLWKFISMSDFFKEIEILYNNYTQIGSFNMITIIFLTFFNILVGGFIIVTSIKFFLDYYNVIEIPKYIFISFIIVALFDLFLMWIMGKYFAIFLLVTLFVAAMVALRSGSE